MAGHQRAGGLPQARIIEQPPDQDLGIEQQTHRC
jgi:hypothetical protein